MNQHRRYNGRQLSFRCFVFLVSIHWCYRLALKSVVLRSLAFIDGIWSERFIFPAITREFSQTLPSFSPGYESTENMFYLRNKTCFPWLQSLVKSEGNVWKNSWADKWKPETQSRVFTCSRILTNFAVVFNRHGGTDMFCSFYKIIIFIVNKEKDDIRSAYCKLSQLGDSQTTWLTSFSCFIALWKHTCRPIKRHVLSKLFYNSFLKILFFDSARKTIF